MKFPKSSQLQIRVSAADKLAIRRAAHRAGLDMSEYVLSCVLPKVGEEFRRILRRVATLPDPRFALAELNACLAGLRSGELSEVVATGPQERLSPYLANYVAAMVETACALEDEAVPDWTRRIAPLTDPAFGSSLKSLRLHLLTTSPPAFRRRNIFIDSTLGSQV